MSEPDLFSLPYRGNAPSQSHSPTSIAAADQIKDRIGPLHRQILDFLSDHPIGASDEQLCTFLDMPANTERPRRRELQLMGRIKDSGRTSFTRSGRKAVVWVLA